jgi:hypothetical protein
MLYSRLEFYFKSVFDDNDVDSNCWLKKLDADSLEYARICPGSSAMVSSIQQIYFDCADDSWPLGNELSLVIRTAAGSFL